MLLDSKSPVTTPQRILANLDKLIEIMRNSYLFEICELTLLFFMARHLSYILAISPQFYEWDKILTTIKALGDYSVNFTKNSTVTKNMTVFFP